jgi:hypothetical protein
MLRVDAAVQGFLQPAHQHRHRVLVRVQLPEDRHDLRQDAGEPAVRLQSVHEDLHLLLGVTRCLTPPPLPP